MLTMSSLHGAWLDTTFMNAKKRKSFERKAVYEAGIEAAKIEAARM